MSHFKYVEVSRGQPCGPSKTVLMDTPSSNKVDRLFKNETYAGKDTMMGPAPGWRYGNQRFGPVVLDLEPKPGVKNWSQEKASLLPSASVSQVVSAGNQSLEMRSWLQPLCLGA